jgi:hypothetical protein
MTNLRFGLVGLAVYATLAFFWQDISLFDETIYYIAGSREVSLRSFLSGAEFGPLYQSWYWLLSVFVPDTVTLYFVSWFMLVLASVLVVRLATTSGAFWFSFLCLFALPIFRIRPHAYLFAGIILAMGYACARHHRLRPYWLELLGGSLLLAGYVRPEYFYTLPILWFGTLVVYAVRRTVRVRTMLFLGVAAVLALLVIRSSSGGGRSGVAFEQHYNLRAHERGLLPENPWVSSYARQFFAPTTDGGRPPSIVDYARAKPVEFGAHIVRNTMDPQFLVFVAAAGALLWTTRRQLARWEVLFLLAACFPLVSSSLLIFPRLRYYIAVAPLAVALLANALPVLLAATTPQRRVWLIRGLVGVLVGIAVTGALNLKGLWNQSEARQGLLVALFPLERPLSNVRAIADLRKIEESLVLDDRVHRMFDAQGGFFVHLRKRWERIDESNAANAGEFMVVAKAQTVEVFLIDPDLCRFYRTSMETIGRILTGAGYVLHPKPVKTSRVYVRQDVAGAGAVVPAIKAP